MAEGCMVCGDKVYARKMCSKHYRQNRWRRRKMRSLQRIRRNLNKHF